MRRISIALGVVLILQVVGGLAPQSASAYSFMGWAWTEPQNIQYRIDTSGGANSTPSWLVSAVHQAAGEWSSSPTPLAVTQGNNDMWVSTYSAYDGAGGWGGCDDWEGSTCYHGFIQFNLSGCYSYNGSTRCGPRSSTPDVNNSMALHEFGHVFGLNHSSVTSAVMYPSPNAQAPQPDDINGINALYHYNPNGSGDGCLTILTLERTVNNFGGTSADDATANPIGFAKAVALTALNYANAAVGKTQRVNHPC